MFMAGVIPGIVAGLMLMIGIYIAARVKKLPALPWAGFREVFDASLAAAWGLFLIVIIMRGIYGGIFPPPAADAGAAVYAFVVALFLYRQMGPYQGVAWRAEGEGRGAAAARTPGST